MAVTVVLVVAALNALFLTLSAAPASAAGGISSDGTSARPGKAKLKKNGKAIAPANAPVQVQNAINAANRIRKKPYIYGGGHRSFNSRGYDCSGAVSYVLHAAKMLRAPLPSGSLARWGRKGKGAWITVYANGGHAYAVIAGLRWDTSAAGASGGKGPRWRSTKRSPRGYRVRHFPKF